MKLPRLPDFGLIALAMLRWMKNAEAGASGIASIENDIMKSAADSFSYRGLVLANKLKVLLVHDPDAQFGAVCLSVGVGSFDDPKDLPGLTSLLGIMLLWGSKENPEPFTGMTGPLSRTTKHTQTLAAYTEPSGQPIYSLLKEFVTYFTDPLLNLKDTNPEVLEQIIDSGLFFQFMNRNLFRMFLVERMLINEAHPYFNLSQGNTEILHGYPGPIFAKGVMKEHPQTRELVHNRLRDLFDRRYSANNMTLALRSKDSLDVMQEQVQAIFGSIRDTSVQRADHPQEEYLANPGRLGLKIYIALNNVAVEDRVPLLLRINFPTPDVHLQYDTAAPRYVTHLIEHGEAGGLAHILQQKDLCLYPKSTYDYGGGLGVYSIRCFPTSNGQKHMDDIIGLIFQYIKLARRNGVNEEMFNHIREIDETVFNTTTIDLAPMTHVENLAADLQEYPFKDVLSYKFVHNEWNPPRIHDFLTFLTPDNMSATIVSEKPLGTEPYQKETWLDTEYRFEEIPKETIVTWAKMEPSDILKLPSANAQSLQYKPVAEKKGMKYLRQSEHFTIT